VSAGVDDRQPAGQQTRRRIHLRKTITIAAIATGLAGCGGSSHRTQAQIQACWNREVTTFIGQYDQELGTPGAGEALLPADAALYEAGRLDPGLTTPEITARFKSIQAKCGKVVVSRSP